MSRCLSSLPQFSPPSSSFFTHAPFEHVRLLLHDAPVPHRQVPVLEQLSAFDVLQVEQTPPPIPHARSVGVLQAPLAQHPVGQVCALQPIGTHAPLVHLNAAPHAGPLPHLQPPAVQLLAAFGSQVRQAAPAIPQLATEGSLQVLPAQQPPAQDDASHTHCPPTHRVPVPHEGPVPQPQVPSVQVSATAELQAWQAVPGCAQLDSDWPVQTFPAQQPFAHDDASQMQTPALQRCPVPHAGPPPHAHAPPAVQALARIESQALQLEPAVPQLAIEGVVQVSPRQQPLGQLMPLHTSPVQTPLVQA